MDKKKILSVFEEHLKNSGKQHYSDFFIGVTDDVNKSLFKEHLVPQKGSWYIYAPADVPQDAISIEKHFRKLGMRTSSKRSSGDSSTIYCYAVSPHTVESK